MSSFPFDIDFALIGWVHTLIFFLRDFFCAIDMGSIERVVGLGNPGINLDKVGYA